MTFATEIEKTSSERFTLVRLTFTRYISEDVVLQDGNVQTLSNFPYKVKDVFWNVLSGSAQQVEFWTEQPNIDDTADLEVWDQQEDGTVRMRSNTSIRTSENGANILFLRYYVFLSSSTNGTFYNFDPLAAETDVRLWEPRIIKDPQLRQNSDDSIYGSIKSTASNITVANHDGWFNQFLSDNDSAHNQEVKAWIVSNGEIEDFFTASTKSISVADQTTVALYEATTKLDAQATFGLQREDMFWSENTDFSFTATSISPDKIGRPIPLIIGRNSWHETDLDSPDDGPLLGVVTKSQVFSKGQTSCLVNPTKPGTGTTNREHALCKVYANPTIHSVGSTVRGAQAGFDTEIKIAFVNDLENYQIGDTVRFLPSGEANSYGVVIGLTPFSSGGQDYNIALWCDGDQNINGLGVGSGGTMASTTNFVAQFSLGVICRSDAWANSTSWNGADRGYKPLMLGWDFTANFKSLDSDVTSEYGFTPNIRLVEITLEDNFETTHTTTMSRSFDPTKDLIEFRMGGDENFITHGDVAETFVRSAGLLPNFTSFADADTFLASELQFQIPTINNQRDVLSYRRYLSLVTKSLGTYFTTNSDGEIVYRFLVPSTAGTEIGDIDIINDKVIRRRIWSDIASRFYTENEHIVDDLNLSSTQKTFKSDRFRFLHQSQNDFIAETVLVDAAGTERVAKIRRNRKDIYEIEVSHRFWGLEIGDTITLTHKQTDDVATNLTVIGITKSVDKLSVTARDFGELD